MLATAESWNDRFGPFVFQNVFLYVLGSRKKNLADFFWVLPLQKAFFFGRGGWLARFPELRACPQFWKTAS